MKPHVTSLELSRELKSLGFPQEGVWWWNNFDVPIHFDSKFKYGCDPKGKKSNMGFHIVDKHAIDHRKTVPTITNLVYYVAPTVGELGEVLPFGYVYGKTHSQYACTNHFGVEREQREVLDNRELWEISKDNILANSIAKLLIYGIKNKLWEFKDGKLEVL